MPTVEGVTSNMLVQCNSFGRKREACDRCHGQKLRCIFQSQNQEFPAGSCVRCAKAGAHCTTRISGRAGRPRVSRFSSFNEQGGNGRGKRRRQKGALVSNPNLSEDGRKDYVNSNAEGWREGFEGDAVDQDSSGSNEDMTSAHAASSTSVQDTLDDSKRSNLNHSSSIWPGDMLPSFFNEDTGEALSFIAPGLEYSWASHDQQEQPAEVQTRKTSTTADENHFGDVSINVQEAQVQTSNANANPWELTGELVNVGMSNQTACRAQLNPMNIPNLRPPQVSNQNGKEAVVPFNHSVGFTTNLAPLRNVARERDDNTLREGFSGVQHQRMKKLSDFAMDLYAQVVSLDAHNSQPVSAISATALRDQLIGSILKSCIAFSTLLDSFSKSNTTTTYHAAPSSTSSAASVHHNISNSSPSDSSSSSSVSALSVERPMVNELPYQLRNNLYSKNLGKDLEKPALVEITIVLQLVICYIRIVHLYSAMYRRILDYLTAFPLQHDDQRLLPIFPGMQAGGVSLDVFGIFQIKLLVQISVHVLGGIEIALGLPERHRVSKRKAGTSRLLDVDLSGMFVECLMKEQGWQGQNVETVRKHLRDLAEVLESALEM